MSATLPGLTPAQASLFLTLCGRALDSRAPQPFLGDPTADDILARIGYDCSRFPMPASSVTDIALRAKKLDRRGAALRRPPHPTPSCWTSAQVWTPG